MKSSFLGWVVMGALLSVFITLNVNCGPQHEQEKPHSQQKAKPKPLPDDVMTETQFNAIQIGTPESALAALYKHVAEDQNDSGDTTFKSPDHQGVYVIRYGCRASAASSVDGDGKERCADADTIVVAKNYYTRPGGTDG